MRRIIGVTVGTPISMEKLKLEMTAYIDQKQGDVETAIDSIIAVQDSLINGFTFTINYPAAGAHGIELRAGVCMTWGEWVKSRYNNVFNDDELLYQDGDELHGAWGDEPVYNSKGEKQTLSDVIVADETYYVNY